VLNKLVPAFFSTFSYLLEARNLYVLTSVSEGESYLIAETPSAYTGIAFHTLVKPGSRPFIQRPGNRHVAIGAVVFNVEAINAYAPKIEDTLGFMNRMAAK